MNWKTDNVITQEMGQEMYSTQDLEICFRELKRDGYSAVSLGLIIDLVRTLETQK